MERGLHGLPSVRVLVVLDGVLSEVLLLQEVVEVGLPEGHELSASAHYLRVRLVVALLVLLFPLVGVVLSHAYRIFRRRE